MKLSLSGFLFEDGYSSQSLDLTAFCGLAREAGYQGVELRDTQINFNAGIAERRAALSLIRDEGLSVTCLTARSLPASGPQRDENFKRYLELCFDLECRLLKISGEPAWLRAAAVRAADMKVTLATNNHVGGRLETVAGTRQYLAEIGIADFGLLYDALHLSIMGQDYLACIPEFFGRVRNILVHSLRPAQAGEQVDIARGGRSWTKALPDEPGIGQDWPGIFRAFKRLGYQGLITFIESGWPPAQRADIARHGAIVLRSFWERA